MNLNRDEINCFKAETKLGRVVDTWCDVSHMSNLSIKLEQKRIWERGSPFSRLCVRDERRGGEKERNPNFSLRSTKFRWSEFVGLRTKVHLLDKGYVCVPKKQDFAEDSRKVFGKSKVSGLGSVYGTS